MFGIKDFERDVLRIFFDTKEFGHWYLHSSLINTKNKKAQDLSCDNVKVLSFFVSINSISQRILFIVFSS